MTLRPRNVFRGLFLAFMLLAAVYGWLWGDMRRMTAQTNNMRALARKEQVRLDSLRAQVEAHQQLIDRLKQSQIELTKQNRNERFQKTIQQTD